MSHVVFELMPRSKPSVTSSTRLTTPSTAPLAIAIRMPVSYASGVGAM